MQPVDASAVRSHLIQRLFPQGVPALWCPLVTHYRADGSIDEARMAAHLRHLSPFVKGYLIPGSTGDGWEMDDTEIRRVLEIALEQAHLLNLHVLIGVLKTEAEAARKTIHETLAWLKSRTGTNSHREALLQSRVAGFTVCPPRGANLSQEQMGSALASILEIHVPVALYQLPQVTQNEMSPALLADLSRRFPHFILFKDTSGADRVALSAEPLHGVFMVRGAEGNYASWLKTGGGQYDGFLLSTANCFACELHQIVSDSAAGRVDAARDLSNRVSAVVKEAFALAASVKDGNPFANANKAMDHFFAHGRRAMEITPPRLHAGSHLPMEMVKATGELLQRHGFMPAKGYLA